MFKNNIESNAVRYITEVLQEQLIMRKNKKKGGGGGEPPSWHKIQP
ncbi:hypothetical protein [Helicobacter trogontum]|nr:hypothetical protein [Helicobacter trogontum]